MQKLLSKTYFLLDSLIFSQKRSLTRSILVAIEKLAPGLVHPCPYEGRNELIGKNFEQFTDFAIPQIIPTGLFKFVLRFHTRANVSYGDIIATVHIDAKDIMKRMDIG